MSKEQDHFGVIKTPDQMIAEATRCSQDLISGELQIESYFVKDDDGWKVIFNENSDHEQSFARDDAVVGDVVALLRLAEGVMSLNKDPMSPDHKQISLEGFFKKSVNDKDKFGRLHTRMSYDPVLTYTVLANLEDIFEVPAVERLYRGFQDELINRPEHATEDEHKQKVESGDEEITDKGSNTLKVFAKWTTIGVFVTAGASCGLVASNGSTPETLVPLKDPITSTTFEEMTTSSIDETCGEVAVVMKGENLTQISNRCGETIENIALWNNIENVNRIEEGQVLRLSEPEVSVDTTTTIPVEISETTIPAPETTSATTSTTVVAEDTTTTTIPVEISETTVVPAPETTLPVNDGVLSEAQCNEYGGFSHRFQPGEYLYNALQKIYGIQENQAATLLGTSIIEKYRLTQITASTPGQKGAECMPPKEEFIDDLPAPIFPDTTTP